MDENRRDTLWVITGLPFSGREELARIKGKGRAVRLASFFGIKNRAAAITALDDGCRAMLLCGMCGSTEFRRTLAAEAAERGYRTVCCFMRSHLDECASAAAGDKNPGRALRLLSREAALLDIPDVSEGFDRLFYVRTENGEFSFEDWRMGDEL